MREAYKVASACVERAPVSPARSEVAVMRPYVFSPPETVRRLRVPKDCGTRVFGPASGLRMLLKPPSCNGPISRR